MSVRPSVPSLDSSSDMLLVCCLYRLSIDVCLLLQPGRGQQTSIDIDVYFLCVLLMYIFILCFIFGPSSAKSSTVLCHNINKLTYLLFDRRRRQSPGCGRRRCRDPRRRRIDAGMSCLPSPSRPAGTRAEAARRVGAMTDRRRACAGGARDAAISGRRAARVGKVT